MTNFFIYLVGLFVASVTAVELFGDTIHTINHNGVFSMIESLKTKDINITHVYHGSSIEGNKEFGNLLVSANITEGYAYDRYINGLSISEESRLTKRTVTVCNSKALINLGDVAAFNICNTLAGLAGSGGGGALALVASGAYCTANENGLTTTCNILWTFSGGAVGGITAGIINKYCPPLLSDTTTVCKGSGGDSQTNDGKYEIIEDLSQTKHESCDDIIIKCAMVTPTKA